ncbi:MORC family CW-type zinc finger protein 1 [Chelonia mydas]|uniref:MORC family CW-type zinc finger protein 1 n=1 Tax=Chelonia mydas TaxID=8469 RepID=M7CB15_CHEMY|nr:MORC family CW-type zinc finger protein 1 [Chelonia mydas]
MYSSRPSPGAATRATAATLLFILTLTLINLAQMIVPITSWSRSTRKPVIGDLEKFTIQTSIIFKYSPFKSETELLQQFDAIYGRSGTFIVIYNLKLMLSGEPELDIRTDSVDILIAGLLDKAFLEQLTFLNLVEGLGFTAIVLGSNATSSYPNTENSSF